MADLEREQQEITEFVNWLKKGEELPITKALRQILVDKQKQLHFQNAPSRPASFDEKLIQALSALSRKANPVKIIFAPTHNNSTNNNTNNSTNNRTNALVEVIQSFVDIMRQCTTYDKSPPPEYSLGVNNTASTSGTNGSHQYPPGLQQTPVTVTANTFPTPGPSMHGATTAPMYAPQVAPAPPPVYQPYQPMQQTGLYYPPQYRGLPTGMEMPFDKPGMRMQVPVTMHPPAPVAPPAPPASHAPPVPPASHGQPVPPNNYAPPVPPNTLAPPPFYQTSHYAMGQYTQHYYQRHQ